MDIVAVVVDVEVETTIEVAGVDDAVIDGVGVEVAVVVVRVVETEI